MPFRPSIARQALTSALTTVGLNGRQIERYTDLISVDLTATLDSFAGAYKQALADGMNLTAFTIGVFYGTHMREFVWPVSLRDECDATFAVPDLDEIEIEITAAPADPQVMTFSVSEWRKLLPIAGAHCRGLIESAINDDLTIANEPHYLITLEIPAADR